MPFIEQLSVSPATIVITTIMVLASAVLLYSQGLFSHPRPARKKVSNKAGNGGMLGTHHSK